MPDTDRVELHEAIELIRPAVHARGGTWADFGAGRGTFTRALAELLGPDGLVLAIDHDDAALRTLRRIKAERHHGATISAVKADVRHLERIPELSQSMLDGAVFGNVLHFLSNAETVVARAAAAVRPGGRVIVIEYDGVSPSRWVPYPLSITRFFMIAESAGLRHAAVVAERRSAYRGRLYCAAAVRPERDAHSPISPNTDRTVLRRHSGRDADPRLRRR